MREGDNPLGAGVRLEKGDRTIAGGIVWDIAVIHLDSRDQPLVNRGEGGSFTFTEGKGMRGSLSVFLRGKGYPRARIGPRTGHSEDYGGGGKRRKTPVANEKKGLVTSLLKGVEIESDENRTGAKGNGETLEGRPLQPPG